MKNSIQLFTLSALLGSAYMLQPFTVRAQEASRISLNHDWKFQQGDSSNGGIDSTLNYSRLKDWILPTSNEFVQLSTPFQHPKGKAPEAGPFSKGNFDDSAWRTLNLPHDWGIEGPFKSEYPGETGKLPWWGVAWYRRTITVDKADKGKQFYLDVDGAMSYASVWCNGQLAGGWAYGYSSFRVDLTPYLKEGKVNQIAIRIDNPKESSRWYPGGGIYRNIWLVKAAPIHIAHWGTYLTTPSVDKDLAIINYNLTLKSTAAQKKAGKGISLKRALTVHTDIFAQDAEGKPTGTSVAQSEQTLTHLTDGEVCSQQFQVKNPKLWDIKTPENRYIAVTTLLQAGREIDRYSTPFGIRSIEWTTNDGFHLNGQRVQLHGVCMHHDLGALGAAFNWRAAERQLKILKEMGVNALRTSHNPPAPEVLTLCDRMGILVLDEFSDTWTMAKKKNGYALLYTDWHEQDFRALIRRDRNHPSVIAWSTGNEIGEQYKPEKFAISQSLTDLAHSEDSTRVTTFGSNLPVAANNGFQNTIDVFGFNYKPHLYEEFHRNHTTIPFYGSETASCISSRGEYAFPVSNDKKEGKIGFQMSSYDLYAPSWATPPDWEFKGQEQNPASAGEFVWTGFDYLGEPTPFNSDLAELNNYSSAAEKERALKELAEIGKIRVPSRSSYFGIIDLAGFPKDRYYLYQAHWRSDLPMAHLLPHWTWPERIGEITPVHVYTSGDSAEVFINGVSQGAKKRGPFEYRLRWDSIRYEPGELKVIAYKDGKKWAEDCVQTASAPAKLELSTDRTNFKANGEDLLFITVRMKDSKGTFAPQASNLIRFSVNGPAEIVATDNGDATSHASFQNHYVQAYNGLALVILRSTSAKGKITLTAESEGLTGNNIQLSSY
ncbi:MAG: DUF4982 domain-containing protein [Bacteroidaceae bacterium]|nr:DUF4982 domain-containing protein [Bacteroidaceae bacterium]